MALNLNSTTVTSNGSTFVVNNGSTNVINGIAGGFVQTNGALRQSQDVALGNSWYELPGTYRGAGGGFYRRAAKWFSGTGSGSQTNSIFSATPNYGWSDNVIYYKIYGGGYQGTQWGEYFYNSDGSANGSWTPLQYSVIGAFGGVGAVAPTISTITRSGNTVDTDYYTYTIQHTMPQWSSTIVEVEWLQDYFNQSSSITAKYQIALL